MPTIYLVHRLAARDIGEVVGLLRLFAGNRRTRESELLAESFARDQPVPNLVSLAAGLRGEHIGGTAGFRAGLAGRSARDVVEVVRGLCARGIDDASWLTPDLSRYAGGDIAAIVAAFQSGGSPAPQDSLIQLAKRRSPQQLFALARILGAQGLESSARILVRTAGENNETQDTLLQELSSRTNNANELIEVVGRYLSVRAVAQIIENLGHADHIRQVRDRRSTILDLFAASRPGPEVNDLALALAKRKCSRQAKQLVRARTDRPA